MSVAGSPARFARRRAEIPEAGSWSGPYIADFLCIQRRLIVELGRPPHDDEERKGWDAVRDEWLRGDKGSCYFDSPTISSLAAAISCAEKFERRLLPRRAEVGALRRRPSIRPSLTRRPIPSSREAGEGVRAPFSRRKGGRSGGAQRRRRMLRIRSRMRACVKMTPRAGAALEGCRALRRRSSSDLRSRENTFSPRREGVLRTPLSPVEGGIW